MLFKKRNVLKTSVDNAFQLPNFPALRTQFSHQPRVDCIRSLDFFVPTKLRRSRELQRFMQSLLIEAVESGVAPLVLDAALDEI